MVHPKIIAAIESCKNHDQLRSCINFLHFPNVGQSEIREIFELMTVQSKKIIEVCDFEESVKLLEFVKSL